jgi:hypothetical protein
VLAVTATFVRFFPPWADGLTDAETTPPHHIFEDLALLKAAFRCANREIQAEAVSRIAGAVRDNPRRRSVLLRLVADVGQRDVPDVTLSPEDDAMARLARALGAPVARDPRLPAPPERPRMGPLFNVQDFAKRSRERMRLEETAP